MISRSDGRVAVICLALGLGIAGFVGGHAVRRYVAYQAAQAQIYRYSGCMGLVKYAYASKPSERDGRKRLIRLFGMQADCLKAAGFPSTSLTDAEAIAGRY